MEIWVILSEAFGGSQLLLLGFGSRPPWQWQQGAMSCLTSLMSFVEWTHARVDQQVILKGYPFALIIVAFY